MIVARQRSGSPEKCGAREGVERYRARANELRHRLKGERIVLELMRRTRMTAQEPLTRLPRLRTRPPGEYLVEDKVIDVSSPMLPALAADLWLGADGQEVPFAAAAFAFVRDHIAHSGDVSDPRVPLSASETLREGVGLCYAKAHLLTALLRARGVPTGLCYQRLTDHRGRHQVHGLVAVYLRGSWHRLDPRGNKPGVDARFSVRSERLAWPVRPELGERDYPDVYVHPHPTVVAALRGARDNFALCQHGLPRELGSAPGGAPV